MKKTEVNDYIDRWGMYPSRYWATKLGDGDRVIKVCGPDETDGIAFISISHDEYEQRKRTK